MHRFASVLALIAGFSSFAAAQTPAYKNPHLPVESRVRDLLGRMTTEEKLAQLRSDSEPTTYEPALQTTGFGSLIIYRMRSMDPATLAEELNRLRSLASKSRLGIPFLTYEEALHGLILDGHTSFPQSIGLAASWDPALVHQVADAIAEEAHAQGVSQVLSPVINVVRDARWGRVEETYGEDPLLSARMGVAFVSAFENKGIVTTPKHYVANLWDGGRDSNSVHISERQLFEIYMPPFEAVIREAGASSIMCSYNAVNGVPVASDPWLLDKVLRGHLGFNGFVLSDWGAASNVFNTFHQAATAPQAAALLVKARMNSEAPSVYLYGKPLEEAVKRGLVSPRELDRAVSDILRVKFSKGLFDAGPVDPEEAAKMATSPEHRSLALEAARKAMVLLKNDAGLLPLPKGTRLAVLGDIADSPIPLGGYSGNPGKRDTILEALRRETGGRILFIPGCSINPDAALPAIPASALGGGLKGEYWDTQEMSGSPKVTRNDPTVDFNWGGDAPMPGFAIDHFSARWTGNLTAEESGDYDLSITSDDGSRLWVGDRLVADNWGDHGAASMVAHVRLQAGIPMPIKLEFYENGGDAVMKLGWRKVENQDVVRQAIANAASQCDAFVVFAGIREGEGQDRSTLALPGNQEAMIQAASATGKPVIVVLVAGAPVSMESWISGVPAILDAWYPGEEGPAAIAETLFGENNPAGKLPITFPQTVGQCPLYYNYEPSGRGYGYVDRSGEPLFPFGHGLSYTKFQYDNLQVSPGKEKGTYQVSIRVTNSGPRAGDEVVQLYTHQQVSSVLRPFKELKGFERISLQPGESQTVGFTLGVKELSIYNRAMKRVVEPGAFDVMVGSSSADIRAQGTLTVK